MTPSHKALRELAERATPGQWVAIDGIGINSGYASVVFVKSTDGYQEGDVCQLFPFAKRSLGIEETRANLYFIAAANPTAVLGLLDRVEELEAIVRRMYETRGTVGGAVTTQVSSLRTEQEAGDGHGREGNR